MFVRWLTEAKERTDEGCCLPVRLSREVNCSVQESNK